MCNTDIAPLFGTEVMIKGIDSNINLPVAAYYGLES